MSANVDHEAIIARIEAEIQALPEPTIDTPKGTRVRFSVTRGYIPIERRPKACREAFRRRYCICGECAGEQVLFAGTWDGTFYYADNSIEGRITFDQPILVESWDGTKWFYQSSRIVQFKAPSGDACF